MGESIWQTRQEVFRRRLTQLRMSSGHTQTQLAEKLGKPQSYISKVESGERRMEFLEVVDYCEACGIAISNFTRQFSKEK